MQDDSNPRPLYFLINFFLRFLRFVVSTPVVLLRCRGVVLSKDEEKRMDSQQVRAPAPGGRLVSA